MKLITILLLASITTLAQQYQNNDPYPTANVILEINFQVDKFFPIFGISENPYSNEK